MLSIYFIFPIKSFYQKFCSGIFLLRLQLGGVTVEKLFHTKCLLSIWSYLSQPEFLQCGQWWKKYIVSCWLWEHEQVFEKAFAAQALSHRQLTGTWSLVSSYWQAHKHIWSALSSPAHKHIGKLAGELCFQESYASRLRVQMGLIRFGNFSFRATQCRATWCRAKGSWGRVRSWAD